MANIKFQIEEIYKSVSAIVDAKILPDYIDLRYFQDHQGYNDFCIELHLGKDNEVDVELKLSDIEDRLKANIKVMDFLVGVYGSEKLLIPHLKDYLSKHPLLQFPDYPSGFENVEYYLSKSIPPKYTKEIYVALVLIVQDFFNDIAWYIS